jgi:tetratricopeptide (TPR) repeat protein
MNYKEILDKHNTIVGLIVERRIAEAFKMLAKLTDSLRNLDFRTRLANNEETYRNILKYSFEQGDDPEKEKVYDRLVKSVLELADEVKDGIIQQENLLSYYKLKERQKNEIYSRFEVTKSWVEEVILETDSGIKKENKQNSNQDEAQVFSNDEEALKFFRFFWLNDKLSEQEIQLAERIVSSEHFPWYFKSLFVSAITLSSLRHFDIEKIKILFDAYQGQEHQVWQRALVGILILLYKNDYRVQLYPEIEQRIKIIQENPKWNKAVEATVIQFLRAKDTEKVTEKLKKEILPELWKIRDTLEDKLNMEELLKDKMLEDKNPEWERVFEDSPDLYNKIEEFSNLQLEGSDVFISAFSMLKRFDFFNYISNWFLPFYKENQSFSDAFKDVKEGFDSSSFLQGLERTSFLCNSDKYSFCLNVKHMPSMQKSMMVELFNMELQAMNEMASEDELLRKEVDNRAIIVQYIQDLYRFFRLHPLHREFQDVFDYRLDFHNKKFFRKLVDDNSIIRNIAEFYFEKDHYSEALEIFLSLEEKDTSYELLEKSAYCYQLQGDFNNALTYYQKAELVSKPRTWLYNKIAFCHRRLGEYKKANHYYLESEKLDPENLYIQTSLGQVHMEMEEYEEALKYFFKVEYLAPDNIKIQRPIAWSSFLVGKTENAKKYYEKIIAREGNKYDYMNLGHVYWSMGDKPKAIENYRTSLKNAEMDFNWFTKTMEEDFPHLLKYNIPEFDMPLMMDYIKMSAAN